MHYIYFFRQNRVVEIAQKEVGITNTSINNNLQLKSHWNKYLTKLVTFLLTHLLLRLPLPKIITLKKQRQLPETIPEPEIVVIVRNQIKLITYQRSLGMVIMILNLLSKKLLPVQMRLPVKTTKKLLQNSSRKRVEMIKTTKVEIIEKIREKTMAETEMGVEISVKSSNKTSSSLCQVGLFLDFSCQIKGM